MALGIFPFCFGVLNLVSGIYCTIFQAQNTVVWYEADATCRENNGTLFKLDKVSFNEYLLPQTRFNTDSWVAATSILTKDTEAYFRNVPPSSSYRCIAVETKPDCSVRYLHKACNASYRPICEWNYGRQWIDENQMDWKDASKLCQRLGTRLAKSINGRQLFNLGPCQHGLYWTGMVIQVFFQNKWPNYNLDACGILRNHILSFENCTTRLQPLCEIEDKTTTRPPHRYYYTSSTPLYSFLKTSAIASKTTSRTMSKTASRTTSKKYTARSVTTYKTIKIMPTNIILTSTAIKQFVAFEVASQRSNINIWLSTGVKEENKSSFPSEEYIERDIGARNFSEPKTNSPDIAVIVGSVLGGIVFLVLIVTLIILLRKRWSQGNETSDATKQKNSTRANKSMISTYSVEKQTIVLQPVNNNEEHVPYTSHLEQRTRCVMEEISKYNNSIYSMAGPEINDANYATVKPKASRKASTHFNDQLNDQKEIEIGNVCYDHANFILRDCSNVQSESIYVNQPGSMNNTAHEYGKSNSHSDGVYDKAKIGGFGEYDRTYLTRRDTDFTYDHV